MSMFDDGIQQRVTRTKADTEDNSYEGLPSNFSLAANMTAGAFAGIAVRSDNMTLDVKDAKTA